jgi:hypothetical protein
MSRQTFVIQVYDDGATRLENLSTQERVSVPDLAAVGAQIERWLTEAADDAPASDGERNEEGATAQSG